MSSQTRARAVGSVAVLGGGARRLAVARRLGQEGVDDVWVWPPLGRPWEELAFLPASDIPSLAASVRTLGIGLAVVVDERCLLEGLSDLLRMLGVAVFAPTLHEAEIEHNKLVIKRLFERLDVPTPPWREVDSPAALERAYGELGPLYLKRSPSLGSRGVEAMSHESELLEAWRRSAEGDPAQILAEKAVPGDETMSRWL